MAPLNKYHLKNLDCANCAAKIEAQLRATPGVEQADLNFATCTLTISGEDAATLERVVTSIEPEVEIRPFSVAPVDEDSPGIEKQTLLQVGVAMVLWLVGLIFHEELHQTPFSVAEYLVLGTAYLLVGFPVLKNAWNNIREGNWLDENFLMSIATIGAIAIHEVPEAVGVMLFYQVGELIQGRTLAHSRRSIQALLQVRPDQAHLKQGDQITTLSPELIKVGDVIVVRPGERIPLDGVVVSGSSLLDTAALTGESVPRSVDVGIDVLAGMINQNGLLEIEVARPFAESTVVRMMELVENAANRKAKTERFITSFSKVYTPVVVGMAFLLAVIPPLVVPGAQFSDWLYRALVLLVISCPCALMISVPLGYFGGLGAASRQGILVKGANYLDVLSKVKTVVFDKTGTLTKGVFTVQEIVPVEGVSEEVLLQLAAMAEAHSSHPIAESIRKAYGKTIDFSEISGVTEIPGRGVYILFHGSQIVTGNDALLHEKNISHPEEVCDLPGTVVYVAKDNQFIGVLKIGDQIKKTAKLAISHLREQGVEKTIMLTGDNQDVAEFVAADLGLDEFHAQLLPLDKLEKLEAIMKSQSVGQRVAFVGDGINDAPVIARADVGIAMGGMGSEAAIETADVVLLTDSPDRVATAIAIGKHTRRIVWQNIIIALAIKFLFIGFGLFGAISIWLAVFADVGVAVLAVLNAARILKIKA